MPSEAATGTKDNTDRARQLESLYRGLLIGFLLPVISVFPVIALQSEEEEVANRIEQSPLRTVPGVTSKSVLPAVIYAFSFVGLVAALVNIGFGHGAGYGIILALCVLIGVGVAFKLYSMGMERELARRIGYGFIASGAIAAILLIVQWQQGVITLGQAIQEPSVSATPTFAVFLGVMAGNGHLVKCEEIQQERKRSGDTEDTGSFVSTSPDKGSEKSNKKGQDIIETFAENQWVVPDGLPTKAKVKETRRIQTYRDIVRALWVDSTRYEKTVPATNFRDEKSKHREDYNNRENVAPSGFSSKTYTFYVPGSKDTVPCNDCKGDGSLDCTSCSRRGTLRCGSCNGSGSKQCRKCGGDSQIDVKEKCKRCGGSGTTNSGFECSRCAGYGSVERSKSCPNCLAGEVDCSNCGGEGKVICDDCGGEGVHACEKCAACGELTTFEYVKRKYSPDTDVTYRTKSVPESVITDAKGKQISKETDNNPSKKGLYRRQDETRKIPVISTIYEYLGDKWELFEVEGEPEAVDFPRDFTKQFRIVQAVTMFCVPMLLILLAV
jgi:hypothetical protein